VIFKSKRQKELKRLYWWFRDDGTINAGDELSRDIVSRLLDMRGYSLCCSVSRKRMLAVGSVIHYANTGDCIWGTGVNGKIPENMHRYRDLDVRAVRGPKTREYLQNKGIAVPEVFGDPGILTDWIYPLDMLVKPEEFRSTEPSVIRHLNEPPAELPSGTREIDPRVSSMAFTREIVRSSCVLSSSLHGVIIAEAFGVPAVLVRPGSDETEFKYEDYFRGTGRSGARFASSYAEAVSLPHTEFRIPREAKQALFEAFPYDLWA